MSSFADVGVVLRVNVHCPACKMQMMEVLGSVTGVYSVDIDGREGLARVRGEVDPNILLKALARTGMHAQIDRVSLNHPMMSQHQRYHRRNTGYGYDAAVHGYGYGSGSDPRHHNYYPTNHHNTSSGYNNYQNYGAYPEHPWCHNTGTNTSQYRGQDQYSRQSYPRRRTMPAGASGGGGCGPRGGYGTFNGGYGYGPGYTSSSSSCPYYADHDLGQNCNIM